jgi:phosphate starvation-inducible protein PhoH and related proteins
MKKSRHHEYDSETPVQPQRKLKRSFEAKGKNQTDYVLSIIKNDITFCSGPSGTGKSFISAGIAAQHLLRGKTQQLIVTRPLVTAGASLGAVPGDIQEKVRPYLKPMEENLRHFLGDENFDALLEDDIIRFEPLELMRGASYHNSYMILDEAQNCTLTQIKMFITRIGENSKVIINGDTDQTDLKRDSGLHICVKKLDQLRGVGICELTDDDIQRNPIIKSVLMALKNENIYD